MKALIPLLIVSTSALAVTTVQFAQRAGAERKRADEAQAIAEQRDTRIRELERARTALEEQLMEAQRPPMPASDAAVASAVPSSAPQPIRQKPEYQKTLPERSQVNRVREQMQNMGVPITDDQRARLLDILIQERQENPRPMPVDGVTPEEQFQQSIRWQEETDRAFLERAQGVLTSEQFARYRDFQEWQSEMRNNALRNVRPGQGNTVSSVFVGPDSPPPKQ